MLGPVGVPLSALWLLPKLMMLPGPRPSVLPATRPFVLPAIVQLVIRTAALGLSALMPFRLPVVTQLSRFRVTAVEFETAMKPAPELPAAVLLLAVTLLLSSTRRPNWLFLSCVFSIMPVAETLAPGLTRMPPLAAPVLLRMIESLTWSWLVVVVELAGTKSMPTWVKLLIVQFSTWTTPAD